MTAERFIPDEYGEEEGGRLYRTGDVARWRECGEIEYLGRMDHQVKVRGYRIELGEIEAALSKHGSVREGVVMAREDESGGKRIVAYIVEAEGEAASADEMRSYLKRTLPDYMVPQAFVKMKQMPLTANGKVDRRALPVPDTIRPALTATSVAPRDSIEFQLLTIWEDVLKIQPIGVQDNFFELGGDSLLAVRLFAQIEIRFGKNLPLATLFKSPTVEQLAGVLHREGRLDSWPSLVAIQPRGSKPPLYCVHACGANIFIYRALARHLGQLKPDQPIYGLQAQGLDGKQTPYTRIEDMAAHYIKEIRAHQPEGPYYLLGHTWGGLIVFEMAQQLRLQGQQVALVAMLDTLCKLPPLLGRRIRGHIGHLMKWGLKRYALAAAKMLKTRITGRTPTGEEVLVNDSPKSDDPLQRTMDAIYKAQLAYVPPKNVYPGSITYFFARDNRYVTKSDDNRLDWKRAAAEGMDMYVIPGRHDTIQDEPYVAELAEKLSVCLDKAHASVSNKQNRAHSAS
jgi:thioesterase domain-containing protein/acyl carrier protein